MNIPTISRWQQFRCSDDSIPVTPFEAAVFLDNAWHHMLASEHSCHEGRKIVLDAHTEVNRTYFDVKEVA